MKRYFETGQALVDSSFILVKAATRGGPPFGLITEDPLHFPNDVAHPDITDDVQIRFDSARGLVIVAFAGNKTLVEAIRHDNGATVNASILKIGTPITVLPSSNSHDTNTESSTVNVSLSSVFTAGTTQVPANSTTFNEPLSTFYPATTVTQSPDTTGSVTPSTSLGSSSAESVNTSSRDEIIGSIVGAIALLILIGLGAFLLVIHRKRRALATNTFYRNRMVRESSSTSSSSLPGLPKLMGSTSTPSFITSVAEHSTPLARTRFDMQSTHSRSSIISNDHYREDEKRAETERKMVELREQLMYINDQPQGFRSLGGHSMAGAEMKEMREQLEKLGDDESVIRMLW
ncbi:hypothetical protein PQX77_015336 [Marasmius sp. AFHP31]|nr:hypothetical protein PQX77_015336 [Marasmius sp. AFHP31]